MGRADNSDTTILDTAETPEVKAEELAGSELQDDSSVEEIETAPQGAKKLIFGKLTPLAAGLSSAAVLAVAAVIVVAFALTSPAPEEKTITDSDTPLSQGPTTKPSSSSDDEDEDDADSKDAAKDEKDADASEGGADSGSSNSTPSSGSAPSTGGSNGSGSGTGSDTGSSGSSGGTAPQQVWVPAWDEQVWIDTSHWESVYVYDEPIYEYHSVCNTCGAIISGFAAQHIMDMQHDSYGTKPVQVGSTPIYEDQWIQSGYWTTIHHEGYWK